uniref:Uncharacterized protein n=1 Tax=Trichuris muris TaxID=70415 RepID=A0A5S6R612_TRIMR
MASSASKCCSTRLETTRMEKPCINPNRSKYLNNESLFFIPRCCLFSEVANFLLEKWIFQVWYRRRHPVTSHQRRSRLLSPYTACWLCVSWLIFG